MDRTQQLRQFFAHLVTANAGVQAGSELEAAFASTPREQFVGPPPWKVFTPRGYIETTSDDPSVLYQDFVVSLGTSAPLNNGQPTLHAYCINALGLKKGEHVLLIEIANMPGHAAVITSRGTVEWAYHTDDFRKLSSEEM